MQQHSDSVMTSHQVYRCSRRCKWSRFGASGRHFALQIIFIVETFMKKPSARCWHLCLCLWLSLLVKETLTLRLKSVVYCTHSILIYYTMLANWISGLCKNVSRLSMWYVEPSNERIFFLTCYIQCKTLGVCQTVPIVYSSSIHSLSFQDILTLPVI